MIALFPFQEKIKNEVLTLLAAEQDTIPVLALATGTGKTEIILHTIAAILDKHPTAKIAILAHGQTVIRQQIMNRTSNYEHTAIRAVEIRKDTNIDPYYNVFVGLPVNFIKYRGALPACDFIITDEAHERVGKPEHTAALIKLGSGRQIYLTASHGALTGTHLRKVFFSLVELYKENRAANISMVGVATSWDFKLNHYTSTNELSSKYEITKEQTLSACHDLIKKWSRYSSWMSKFSVLRNAPHIWGEFPKTMVACKSVAMANEVYRFFLGQFGLVNSTRAVLISHGGTDTEDRENLRLFKEDPYSRLLVVCNQGQLGYDVPDLECFVDMTGTINQSRILQMAGRLARKSEIVTSKTYYKVMPASWIMYTQGILQQVICLFTPHYYSSWGTESTEQNTVVVERLTKFISKKGNPQIEYSIPLFDLSMLDTSITEIITFYKDKNSNPAKVFMKLTLSQLANLVNAKKSHRQKLRELAMSGAPRPDSSSYLGKILVNATSNKSVYKYYDSAFDLEIRNLAPHWFVKKQESVQVVVPSSVERERNKNKRVAEAVYDKPLFTPRKILDIDKTTGILYSSVGKLTPIAQVGPDISMRELEAAAISVMIVASPRVVTSLYKLVDVIEGCIEREEVSAKIFTNFLYKFWMKEDPDGSFSNRKNRATRRAAEYEHARMKALAAKVTWVG